MKPVFLKFLINRVFITVKNSYLTILIGISFPKILVCISLLILQFSSGAQDRDKPDFKYLKDTNIPETNIRSQHNTQYTFEIIGHEKPMEQCITTGMELVFEYTFQICTFKKYWFDDCKDDRFFINKIRYEPVSEVYTIVRDLINDKIDPKVVQEYSINDALKNASTIESVSLDFLSANDKKMMKAKNSYIEARALVYCKEGGDNSIQRLTQGLSFNVIDFWRFDSGWKRIYLNK
jgi:hypothetical protein